MSWKPQSSSKRDRRISDGNEKNQYDNSNDHDERFYDNSYQNQQYGRRYRFNRRHHRRNGYRNHGNRYDHQNSNMYGLNQAHRQSPNHRNYQRNDDHQYTHQNQHQANNKQHPLLNNSNKKVKYVKNTGKFQIEPIPFNSLTPILQRIWKKHYHENAQYLQQLIFLCGPPGCGKSTICGFIEQHYDLKKAQHDEYILDASIICSNVMKENNRVLVIAKVYEKLFEQILQNKNKHKILIIDGFLRKKQHVYVLDFLKQFLKNVNFVFIVMSIDEQTSIKRQLERGQRLIELSHSEQKEDGNEKQVQLKDSDLNEDAARKRFAKYNWHHMEVQKHLKRIKAQFEVIDAVKPLEIINQVVRRQLQIQEN